MVKDPVIRVCIIPANAYVQITFLCSLVRPPFFLKFYFKGAVLAKPAFQKEKKNWYFIIFFIADGEQVVSLHKFKEKSFEIQYFFQYNDFWDVFTSI